MSAEQRGYTPVTAIDERSRITSIGPTPGTDSRFESPFRRSSTVDAGRFELPLTYRIERTRLRARVAALERAVETSEQRRQDVIDQYERLLADRDDADGPERSGPASRSRPLLSRLIGR
ncbi:hypothetical protein [Natrinema sp. 74]|uniref:hypothetical protein n=1 Tax=Natrinema sp. 74 TaxID=3384159 RepID=UPI0038D3C09F